MVGQTEKGIYMSHVLSVKNLMEVGAHFGHHKRRRNPKMIPFIHSERAKIHILDLSKTLPLFVKALNQIEQVVAKGGRVLFVGTKRQAADVVKEEATRCGQHFVNARWLGGTLTNWTTISNSIKRMKDLEKDFESEEFQTLPKKEQLHARRDHAKLERSLGGIQNMGGLPDLVFIVDVNREHIAVAEAKKLGIPSVALVDTNCDPSSISFPIPANDDALKSIQFFSYWVAEAILKGLEKEVGKTKKMLKQKEAPESAEPAKEATEDKAAVQPATKKEAAPVVEKRKNTTTADKKEEKPEAAVEKAPAKTEEAKPATDKKAAEKVPAKAGDKPASTDEKAADTK